MLDLPAPLDPVRASRPAWRKVEGDAVECTREARPVAHCRVEWFGRRARRAPVPPTSGRVVDRDGDVIEREESIGRRTHGQRAGDREGHARYGLECRQCGEREHRHHDHSQVARVDGGDTEREDPRDGDGEADLNHQCRYGGQAGVVPFQPVDVRRQCLDIAEHGGLGAEGEQLGRAGERVDDAGGQLARQIRQLIVSATPPGEQRRDDECDGERDPECERRPRQDHADGHRSERRRRRTRSRPAAPCASRGLGAHRRRRSPGSRGRRSAIRRARRGPEE